MKKNKAFHLVAVLSIIFLCVGLTVITIQNDTFYTLKIGDYILKNGIDMMDHFSWIKGLPYTYPHWLYDCFMSIIFKLQGFNAIYVMNIVLYSTIGILIYYFSNQKTKNYLFSFILTIMTVGFMMAFITARAQIVSFIIFLLEKHFLDKLLEDGKVKNGLILILLSIILINIHLATWIFFFVLFLPPIASHYLSLLLKKIRKNKKDFTMGRINFKTNENTKKLFPIIIICLLTGFLTPLGTTPYTYIFNQFAGDTFASILEYQNINISNGFSFYQYLFVLLVLFLITKEDIDLEDVFLTLGLILMSLIAIRNFAYLLLIGSFVVSNYLYKVNKRLSSKTVHKLDIIFNRKSELITILLCFLVVGTGLFTIRNLSTNDITNEKYPSDAVQYIKENINLEKARIFNEYYIGSYLLYNDIPVFIDSRSDLYTKPFNKLKRDIFNDYYDVVDNLNYQEVFNYYDVTHILIIKNSMLDRQLKKDNAYKNIYYDKYFTLYERKLD